MPHAVERAITIRADRILRPRSTLRDAARYVLHGTWRSTAASIPFDGDLRSADDADASRIQLDERVTMLAEHRDCRLACA